MVMVTVPVSASIFPTAIRPLPGVTKVYNLYATDGWWIMADGTPIYSYGFVGGLDNQPFYYLGNDGSKMGPETSVPPTPGPIVPGTLEDRLKGHAQFPAPIIYGTTNDVIQINLKNLGVWDPANPATGTYPTAPNDPHSIHLHGVDVDVANDGVPETSVAAIPANGGDNGAGNVVVYTFRPKLPGTYFYHCHQEADIHVDMGMYGALVIYNPTDAAARTGPGKNSGGRLFGAAYDRDFIMMVSDTDIRQHASEEISADPAFNPVDYKPQYWFINDISFPMTAHAGITGAVNVSWQNWTDTHPGYDPLITGSVSKKDNLLVRVINMGFETQPLHMHGYHGTILGSDQRPWFWTLGQLEKQTLTIGSGETYEWLIKIADQKATSTYPAASQTRYDSQTGLPAPNTATPIPPAPTPNFPAINDYVGGPTVTGSALGPSTSQIFVFHNHDDYKATNNGVYPGGMFTIIVPAP